jgi:hypothetical protein
MTATAENPVLRKYVVTQEVKALMLWLIKTDNRFSQAATTEEVYLHRNYFSKNCHKICL